MISDRKFDTKQNVYMLFPINIFVTEIPKCLTCFTKRFACSKIRFYKVIVYHKVLYVSYFPSVKSRFNIPW